MKKVLKKLFLVCLIMIMMFSLSACDFISKLDEEQTSAPNTNFNNTGYTATNLPSSLEHTNKVILTSSGITTRNKDASTLKDAYKKVKGTSVAIIITYNNGSSQSAGSGTIVDISLTGEEDSDKVFYVLTCFHVIGVEGAVANVCVPDNNGKNYGDATYNQNYIFTGTIGGTTNEHVINKKQPVTLVGGDKDSDVAVLRLYIEDSTIASSITKAKIIDPQYDVEVADEVFLLGNPTGALAGTFTQGYISYKFRESYTEDIGYMTLYQLNVDAWHGSSGGGLYNLYGELIGILNSGSDDNSGINFAIPFKITDDVATDNGFINIMKQLIASCSDENYGYISGRKVKFGFTVSPNNDNLPYITSVSSGSLSDTKGLKANDVVNKVKVNDNNEQEITSYSQFVSILENLNIGDTIVLTVKRTSYSWGRGTTTTTTITLPVYQFYFCNTKTEN